MVLCVKGLEQVWTTVRTQQMVAAAAAPVGIITSPSAAAAQHPCEAFITRSEKSVLFGRFRVMFLK